LDAQLQLVGVDEVGTGEVADLGRAVLVLRPRAGLLVHEGDQRAAVGRGHGDGALAAGGRVRGSRGAVAPPSVGDTDRPPVEPSVGASRISDAMPASALVSVVPSPWISVQAGGVVLAENVVLLVEKISENLLFAPVLCEVVCLASVSLTSMPSIFSSVWVKVMPM
jgi:hypothetical protein